MNYEPAFPVNISDRHYLGMTLRDYFAAKAMQGELACQNENYQWNGPDKIARYAYQVADAMLAARNNNKEQ